MRENPEPDCETRTRGNSEESDGTLIPNQGALEEGIEPAAFRAAGGIPHRRAVRGRSPQEPNSRGEHRRLICNCRLEGAVVEPTTPVHLLPRASTWRFAGASHR